MNSGLSGDQTCSIRRNDDDDNSAIRFVEVKYSYPYLYITPEDILGSYSTDPYIIHLDTRWT
jgi:hypothetical protein